MQGTVSSGEIDRTNALVGAWALLVALTLSSYWFSDRALSSDAALVVILILTFVKVFMVGHSFMEIHRAPRALRITFASWCVGTCLMLSVLAFTF